MIVKLCVLHLLWELFPLMVDKRARFPTLFRVRGFIALHTLQGLIILQAIRTCNSIFFHSNIVNQMFLQ
jgi:hypothetical protein